MAEPRVNGAVSVESLIPKGLPDGRMLVERGRERARKIDFPVGRYPRLRGVRSDRGYKDLCRACRAVGFLLDRVSLIPARRMGLPPDPRSQAIEETVLMIYTQQDWDGASDDV